MKQDIIKVFSSNLIKMLSTVIVTFFLPKILSVDDYAYIKLFQLYSSYIGVSALGFNDGVFLKYGGKTISECNNNEIGDEQHSFIVYQVILTIIIFLISLGFGEFYLMVWAISFLPTTMFTYYTYMCQSTGEFSEYARIINLNSFLTLSVNFVLLFVAKLYDYKMYVVGYCIVNYLVFAFSFVRFNRKNKVGKGKFKLNILRENMQAGFLLMIGNLVYIFFIGLDKWFSKGLLGLSDFAMYSFSAQLLTVINMFITPISLTLYNYFGKKHDKEFEKEIKDILLVILMLMLCCVFVFKFIILNYIDKYIEAIMVMEILFVSQVFLTLNTAIFVNLYKVYKLQKVYFWKLIIIVALSFVMNIIGYLIFKNNIGFALATLTCMIVWYCINSFTFNYMKFEIKEVIYLVLMLGSYIICCRFLGAISGFIAYVVAFLIFSLLLRKKVITDMIKILKPNRFKSK